jgi:hypothetical protein
VKIGIRIESFAIIKYVVYPQPITYIVYCHAKLQLKVILGLLWVVVGSLWVVVGHCGSLWVVVGSLWVLVDRCGVVVDRCGSLWVVPCFSNYVKLLCSKTMDNSINIIT